MSNIDKLALFAYADKSNTNTKATWRGFLSYFFEQLLELDSDDCDELVGDSIAKSIENIENDKQSIYSSVIKISGELSEIIGMPKEFGIASMLESNNPTKLINHSNKKQPSSEELITAWMFMLEQNKVNQKFIAKQQEWKDELYKHIFNNSKKESA